MDNSVPEIIHICHQGHICDTYRHRNQLEEWKLFLPCDQTYLQLLTSYLCCDTRDGQAQLQDILWWGSCQGPGLLDAPSPFPQLWWEGTCSWYMAASTPGGGTAAVLPAACKSQYCWGRAWVQCKWLTPWPKHQSKCCPGWPTWKKKNVMPGKATLPTGGTERMTDWSTMLSNPMASKTVQMKHTRSCTHLYR